jgi:hypothetical protein
MAFSGDLSDFPFPDLLFYLSSKRYSGWLTLRHAANELTLTLVGGQAVAARSSVAEHRLGARLVADGLLTRGRLEVALAHQTVRDPAPALGALLVELGIVTPDAVRLAVYAQLHDLLDQLLLQPTGAFRWTRGLPDVHGLDLDLNLEREVLAAIGRADEQFAAQLPTARLTVVESATPERLVGAVGEDWPLFEALLDGATSFDAAVAASGWSPDAVQAGLARLHGHGVLRIGARASDASAMQMRSTPPTLAVSTPPADRMRRRTARTAVTPS